MTQAFRLCICSSLFLVPFAANVLAQAVPPTTVQQPVFGVAIDAQGVLTSTKAPALIGDPIQAQRLAPRNKACQLNAAVASRKVSLVRLEQAICRCVDAGGQPDEAMQHLAGLTRIRFVCCIPELHDIVLIGPAEGWASDVLGRTVGLESGCPILRLDDLVVALRAFPPGTLSDPFIGCTIDPTPEGLDRMVRFQRTIPKTIPHSQQQAAAAAIAKGLRDSLGQADVRVFGISAKTHFAQVLVEADYRMKLIGVGLEPPPVPMITFISALRNARSGHLQRWWFTPDYECLRVSDDRRCLELVGQAVQLQTEDKVLGPNGQFMKSNSRPSKASSLYARAFTQKYPEIATHSPVYAQLRGLIDMLVIAAFSQQQDFYGQTDWSAETFLDEIRLPTEIHTAPIHAACVANAVWKQSRLLAPAGGGVSIVPTVSLDSSHQKPDERGVLREVHSRTIESVPQDEWWWD